MAETRTRSRATTEDQVGETARDSEGLTRTELVTEFGKTTINELVVGKIAGIAAREVSGVYELVARRTTEALAGMTQRISGPRYHHGVDVEVGQREAAIDMSLTVEYGVNIPQVSEAVRQNVIARVQEMTGLAVKEVNIDVTDVHVAGDDEPRRVE